MEIIVAGAFGLRYHSLALAILPPRPSPTRKIAKCCNVCATQCARSQGHTIYSVILLDPAPISPLQFVKFVVGLSSLGRLWVKRASFRGRGNPSGKQPATQHCRQAAGDNWPKFFPRSSRCLNRSGFRFSASNRFATAPISSFTGTVSPPSLAPTVAANRIL